MIGIIRKSHDAIRTHFGTIRSIKISVRDLLIGGHGFQGDDIRSVFVAGVPNGTPWRRTSS